MGKAGSNPDEIGKLVEALSVFQRKVEDELEPFIALIREMPKESENLKIFKQACSDYWMKHKHHGRLSRYVTKDLLKTTGTRKDKLQWILWYLCVLEGIEHTVVNLLVILINICRTKSEIANSGRYSHMKRIVKARSLADLEEKFIPLGVKLRFLGANGLKEIAAVIDTEFRNDVAHFRFDVQDEEIVVGDKKIMPLIVENIGKLVRLLAVVSEYLKKLAYEEVW